MKATYLKSRTKGEEDGSHLLEGVGPAMASFMIAPIHIGNVLERQPSQIGESYDRRHSVVGAVVEGSWNVASTVEA